MCRKIMQQMLNATIVLPSFVWGLAAAQVLCNDWGCTTRLILQWFRLKQLA